MLNKLGSGLKKTGEKLEEVDMQEVRKSAASKAAAVKDRFSDEEDDEKDWKEVAKKRKEQIQVLQQEIDSLENEKQIYKEKFQKIQNSIKNMVEARKDPEITDTRIVDTIVEHLEQ